MPLGAWLLGTALVLVVLNLLGVDVRGWLSDLWEQIKAVPTGYIFAALVFFVTDTRFLRGKTYLGRCRYRTFDF